MSKRTIADLGRVLRDRYGLTVVEHPEFGGVTDVHAANSFHKYGEAIDVQDWRPDHHPEYEGGEPLHWQERTRRMRDRFRQVGLLQEVLGPGDAGHDTHLHLAFRGAVPLDDAVLDWAVTGKGQNPLLQSNTQTSAGAARAPAPAPKPPEIPAWKQAAADPNRSRDPNDLAYWQRADMQEWARANPALAAQAMPAGMPVPETPPSAPAVVEFKPLQRGALDGTLVGQLGERATQAPAFTAGPEPTGLSAEQWRRRAGAGTRLAQLALQGATSMYRS